MRRFVVMVSVVAAGCAPSELDAGESDLAAAHAGIIGGTVDNADPAVVALATQGGSFCTGTLIGQKTVLTAAHCVMNSGTAYALFGTSENNPSKVVRVASQTRHPQYAGSDHDVAVFQLVSPVTDVTPIELNTVALSGADVGKNIRHVGFGVTDGTTGVGSGVKRQVAYTLRRVGATEIESGTAGKQTCSGDSGGPAFMVTDGSGVEKVAGVISWGDETCVQFGVDSRVDIHVGWIRQTMAVWEAPTCAEDGKCVQGCAVVDQDCACQSDGVCSGACLSVLKDLDCPRDCATNGVCSQQGCGGRVDLDCVAEGSPCGTELVCATRTCVNDPQHQQFYCSRRCAVTAECPNTMTCAASGVCVFPQKPEAQVGDVCSASVWCRGGICTGPVGEALRCATVCGSTAECPSGYSCEGGVDGARYCRSPTPPRQPLVVLTRASTDLPAAGGCAAAPGFGVGLGALALALRRRRNP